VIITHIAGAIGRGGVLDVAWYNNGKICPTVIDKSRLIGSIELRLCNQINEVIELVDFNIQLLYIFNL
jgi:hypothetical protein